MRTIRVMLAGLLGATAALSLVAATTKAPKKTYTVVGYYAGMQPPSAALQEKAAKAVGAKMTGFTQVQDPYDAEHTVQVRFLRNSYEIYVDALPLQHLPNAAAEKQSLYQWYQQGDLARDYADGNDHRN